mgnify:CR=1 FL=1
MKLNGRTAIVTGAARGIGRAIALRLANEGANVVIADINQDEAIKVANEIKVLGHRAIGIKVDVAKSEDTNGMAETTLNEFDQIDILVNNAGITSIDLGGYGLGKLIPFHKSTESAWDLVIAVNLKGVFNCSRAVITSMIHKKSGRIVNIAAADPGGMNTVGMVDYRATKAGVVGFTRALAKEVGQYGINVNCVSPAGPIGVEKAGFEELKEETLKKVYMGRAGEPKDVANMVTFLASDEASWITGQNYTVCGGLSLGW